MSGRLVIRSFTSISVGVWVILRTLHYKAALGRTRRGWSGSRLPNLRVKHHNHSLRLTFVPKLFWCG
jgi:hypothetical protein